MILLPNWSPKHSRKTLTSDVRDNAVVALHHLLGHYEKLPHQAVHGLWATVHSERWGIRHGTAEHGDELVSSSRDGSA